jgi:hypothetical protein
MTNAQIKAASAEELEAYIIKHNLGRFSLERIRIERELESRVRS